MAVDPLILKDDAAPPAAATSISLNEEADRLGTSISLNDEVARLGNLSEMDKALVRGVNADTNARIVMVVVIAAIFVGLNWAVIAFLRTAFDWDIELLKTGKINASTDRVITTNVFMSLIGATVVQVGVAIIAIMNYLFPKKVVSPTVAATSEGK